jgi:protein-tyrosine phosphatase
MFERIENFRDIGGIPGREGQVLRTGIVYRSGDHSKATADDLEKLKTLNIGVIVDLRRPLERERAPSRSPEGVKYEVITSDTPEDRKDWAVALKNLDHVDQSWFEREAEEFYRTGATNARYVELFGRFFKALTFSEGPILTHCAAGKDRTGMLCALVQYSAGVRHDDIVVEFTKTNDSARIARSKPRLKAWLEKTTGHEVADSVLEYAVRVHPEHVDLMFSCLQKEFGSVDRYLTDILQIDDEMRSKIESRLLE